MDLRQFSLFSGLSEHQLARFAPLIRTRACARREVVCRKGSPPDGLYLVFSGSLQMVDIAEDGRETGLGLIHPGGFFGELSVIDGQPRSTQVVALQPSELGIVPQEATREAFSEVPGFAQAMLQHLTMQVRHLSSFRALLAIPSAQQRVQALLLHLARTLPGGLVVIPDLPRQYEVAIMINTSRETVSRAVAQLCASGVLQRDLHRLIVRDPQRLRSLATQPLRAESDRASRGPGFRED